MRSGYLPTYLVGKTFCPHTTLPPSLKPVRESILSYYRRLHLKGPKEILQLLIDTRIGMAKTVLGNALQTGNTSFNGPKNRE
jgi:hypothetical protein